MKVVAVGVVVRWEPDGFTVVGWHRHDTAVRGDSENDVYNHLTRGELADVVDGHLDTYLPGDDCTQCQGWRQIRMWDDARRPEGT